MSQQIQIRPEDLPNFIAQQKAQKEALEKVLEIKREAIGHLEESMAQSWEVCQMDADVDEDSRINKVAHALHSFTKVQHLEYQLQLTGLEEKLAQTIEILEKVESPILTAPAGSLPPPRGFRAPKLS